MESFDVQLGRQLRALREGRGLTQEGLATKLGLSWHTVSKWERGRSFPDRNSMNRLAEVLGIEICPGPNAADGVLRPSDARPIRTPERLKLDRALEAQSEAVVHFVLSLAAVVVREYPSVR